MYVITLGFGQKQSLKSKPVAGTFIPSTVLSRGLKMTVLIKDGEKRERCRMGSMDLNSNEAQMRRSWEGLIIRSVLLSTEELAAEGFCSKKRVSNHNCHLQITRS